MNNAKIVDLALAAIEDGEASVLCTIVRLDGSGYGRPGARLLLTQSGQREGYISGGCLEKDLCRRVWTATQAGPRLIALDTRGNTIEGSRFGSGCEGVVYVLCQRINQLDRACIPVLAAVDRKAAEARLLTVYRSESPHYGLGDGWVGWEVNDAIQTDNGASCVTLGSDDTRRLPEHVEENFRAAARNASLTFVDEEGRQVEAAIEIIRPRRRLVIFGAGDDVIPLVEAAAIVDWQVTVVGHRPELADPNRLPNASIRRGPLAKIARSMALENTHVVVMTHDFDRDVELLPVLLDSDARSIGLLGPKRRLGDLVKSLYQNDRTLGDRDISRIRSPIGLDIGATSPAEIAMAIMAELIALPNARDGNPLHVRAAPLHEPAVHLVATSAESPQPIGAS